MIAKLLSRHNPTSSSAAPLSDTARVMMLMAASFPFMIYGTLVMFDFLVATFVLLSVIFVIRYAEHRKFSDVVFLGLCLGFGVLAKGPVTYLYVLPLYLLAPFWKANLTQLKSWYLSLLAAVIISAGPVLLWLIPVLQASDNHFAFWLLWNQTAGRVTGNFSAAHARPVFFYLPLLPVSLLPWVFFPSFWKYMRHVKNHFKMDAIVRFLACWFVPVFVAFSLISGKQPHYLVPLLPPLILLVAIVMDKVKTKMITLVLASVSIFFIGGQLIAKHVVFDKFDLDPVVEVIHQYPNTPMAYVSNYNAEFSFLARRTSKIDDIQFKHIGSWFEQHPDGVIIVRYKDDSAIRHYSVLFNMKYRGQKIALIKKPVLIEDQKGDKK